MSDIVIKPFPVNHKKEYTIEVPGSKSITNRALLLAALAKGKSTLSGVLFSDDSRHFLQCLISLGFRVEIDEDKLRRIASIGDGQYFRATDENVLKNVFAEIDKMEKTKLSVQQFSRREEAYMPWAIAAMLLLAIEILLRYTILRNIP